ncbi:glutamate racemase [Polaromonas sp. YR568]|uniref:glutamate racemase n=1 Tax=Polaromonas sp. YR568 TaxID=1855301 RepID=UPI003137BDAF
MRRAIGVFDSGVGGLSVLRALRARLPAEDFIYIADSGHAPYGERDDDFLRRRSATIAAHLAAQNISALVVACNTATAAAIDELRQHHPQLPIVGVEPALKPAVLATRTHRVGVMATRSTLASSRFRALQDAVGEQVTFVLQPCDGLADSIEQEAMSGHATAARTLCAEYIQAMGRFGDAPGAIDTLVLGCTHYPFAIGHLSDLLPPSVQILDNGDAIARQTERLLSQREAKHLVQGATNFSSPPRGEVQLITTGDPQRLQAAAARWLGLEVPVQSLRL